MRKPGKDDRLIGDSSACKASPSAKVSDKAEVPSIGYFSHALDRFAEHEKNKGVGNRSPRPADWILLSIDVKAARKSIATAPEDIGLAVFQLLGGVLYLLSQSFRCCLERLLVG